MSNYPFFTPESDFKYKIEFGGATVLSYVGKATELAVPPTLGGYPVKKVGDYAFSGQNITAVALPESVTELGRMVFHNCAELRGVTIPSGVSAIGDGAFMGCERLEEVTLPRELRVIEGNLFNGCVSLSRITVPEKVTSIIRYSFLGCVSLKEVYNQSPFITLTKGAIDHGNIAKHAERVVNYHE